MIRVSDHALLRYLERDIGIDIEGLRSDLESAFSRAHSASLAIGVSDYAIRCDGNMFIVRRGTVTTVLSSDRMSEGGRFHALAPVVRTRP